MADTARGINDILNDRRVLDWGDKIDKLEPDVAPLLTLTRKLGSEPAKNFKYISFKDSPFERWFYIDAINTGTGKITLELTVGAGEDCYPYINIGDLLYVPAKDYWMRVTEINTGTDELTVVMNYAGFGEGGTDGRVYSGTTAVRTAGESDTLLGLALADRVFADPVASERVLKVSNAFAHGGLSAVSKVLDLTETYNFIQKFLTSYEVDEETMKITVNGEPELERLQARKAIEHQKDIEYQLLLGDRDARTDATHTDKMIYTTAGLLHSAIATDVIATADFNEASFWSFMRNAFSDKMSREKVLLAGGQVVEAISRWALGRMVINDKIKSATGMSVPQYVTPFGMVDVVYHPLLDEGLEGWAWVLDMNHLKLKVMVNTKLKTGIQAPDAYERKDEWWTEVGLKLGLKECHRRLCVT